MWRIPRPFLAHGAAIDHRVIVRTNHCQVHSCEFEIHSDVEIRMYYTGDPRPVVCPIVAQEETYEEQLRGGGSRARDHPRQERKRTAL